MMYLNTQKNIFYSLPLRGAIIGFGGVAEYAHAPLLKGDPRFCITSIVDPDKERQNRAKKIFPDARIYDDLDSLFGNESLDFVDICTPPAYHAEAILKACESGVNVLCEKPLVTSLEQLNKVLEAQKKYDVLVYCVNNWRYAPVWAKTIELVNRNYIGEIREISLFVLRTPKSGGGITDWRKKRQIAGGGILMDHGWHNIYFVNSILKNNMPIYVSARMRFLDHDLEDEAEVNILYEGQIKVNLFLTWRSNHRKNYGHIIGERGEIKIKDDYLILNNDSIIRYNFNSSLSKGSHHLEWMIPVIDDFFNELMGKKRRGENIKEAAKCFYLISLAYESYQKGSSSLEVCNIIKLQD